MEGEGRGLLIRGGREEEGGEWPTYKRRDRRGGGLLLMGRKGGNE